MKTQLQGLGVLALIGCLPLSTLAHEGHDDSEGHSVLELYKEENLVKPIDIVECDLADGSVGECYRVHVQSTPLDDGPYCPESLDETGGIFIYDGETRSGLRVMNRAFFEDMEADGYDIIDEEGQLRTIDLSLSRGDKTPPEAAPSKGHCVEVVTDRSLTLTYTIPVNPTIAEDVRAMDDASDIVGLSFNGLPINGQPPTVSGGVDGRGTGAGNVPALDACGGHINEGFYHNHIFAETINSKYDRHGIDEVECTAVPQIEDNELIGLAMDGYPIYGREADSGGRPTELDACNGHVSATAEYPDGIYHYHAKYDDIVDIPDCLSGTLADRPLEVQ
ncbi:hypothetical protein GCM10007392_27080 [Saccharospirillum salsuginis]|uniref:YHYH domain-containing protein n=2 Tax=Saccharospirillum salsuginis TaxID=418750 RepID=A0A918KCG6_9GAMM|nr:hypothetical protein GCM10007392_27080 [Saccharospirillum salsuginis]